MSERRTQGSDATRFGGLNRTDAAVLVAIVLYAFLFQLGRTWFVDPFPFLGADASKIASFAALADHPDAFPGDELLGDPEHAGVYLTVHVPMIRWLAKGTGEYGTAFASLLGFHVLLHGIGFYVLGRVLFRSRGFAALLTLLVIVPIKLPLYTQWGAPHDPMPRFGFQMLLPFLLAAVVAGRHHPWRGPLVLAATGLLMYVHPVSTPGWAFAIWLSLWLYLPATWSLLQKLGFQFFAGLAFLAAAGPFLANYLLSHARGTSGDASFDQVRPIMEGIFPPGYLDVGLALRVFAERFSGPEGLVLLTGAAGAAFVVASMRGDRRLPLMVLTWLGGILLVALGLPYLDQLRMRAYGTAPVQIDLIRGLRFGMLFALLFSLWGLAEWHRVWAGREIGSARRLLPAALAALFVASWVVTHPPAQVVDAAACVARGRLRCPPPAWGPVSEGLRFVREDTPAGSTFLPTRTGFGLQVRYYGLRPVLHNRWDFGLLVYSDHDATLAWHELHLASEAALAQPGAAARQAAHLELAAALDADYALLDRSHMPLPLRSGDRAGAGEVVFANEQLAVVRMRPPPPDESVPPIR
ncbi:MAG: hypothetical protein OEP95_04635 [Myxococcales bacterium]|nr:hypothetical protein [Myxococcales bacterium]